MKVRAHAKINLGLNVVRKREDGYHELEMVMMPVGLHDLIFCEKKEEEEITIRSNSKVMPTNDTNIMYKTFKLMKERYNLPGGFDIFIYKHIPIQAGLAGGSADCAAVLKAINRMYKLKLSYEQLAAIGKELGADVPFCVYSKGAFVEGIGEKLTFLDYDLDDIHILLVKPRRGVSTKKAFTSLKLEKEIHPDCFKLKEAVEQGNYEGIINGCANTLEAVSKRLVPQISDILDEMRELGFDTAIMSGSGSCCFGLTKNEKLVKEAETYFRNKKYFAFATKFLK